MELKIKEAISVFLAIACISIAAGGDYYYSEMSRVNCCKQPRKVETVSSKLAASMDFGSIVKTWKKDSVDVSINR